MGLITVMAALAVLLLFAFLALPFILAGMVLGLVLFVVVQVLLLPFRLLGLVAAPGAGIILFAIKAMLLVLLGIFLMAGFVIGLAPLLPLLLVVAGLWLLTVSRRPRRRAA